MAQYKGKKRAQDVDALVNPFISGPIIPPNETEEERVARVAAAQNAQRVSRQIDEGLQEGKKEMDKRKRAATVLLLGQAESGKSTILRNFQMAFTPSQFNNERSTWRRVVQLNLITNVRIIIEALQAEEEQTQRPGSAAIDKLHRRLKISLSPLLSIETNLTRIASVEKLSARDVCVRAGSEWKRSLGGTNRNDPTTILHGCKEDIVALWHDPVVKSILEKRHIHLQESSGFFLDDAWRICDVNYEPTTDDIVRARIRTIGVEEHHFVIEKGPEKGEDLYIADVGGVRTSRASWVPYFENVQTILFLAPLAFNKMLEENPSVNRLEDTLGLWQDICKNQLLAKANIIIFFNKKDVLEATLKSGVLVKKYVPSYGDQPNEVESVTKYFREKFRHYFKKLSPVPRGFISYETSAIDTKATSALLVAVYDGILRMHLRQSDII